MYELIKDLWGFMKARKKFWLAPIILIMLLLGTLVVLSQGSAIAPYYLHAFLDGSPARQGAREGIHWQYHAVAGNNTGVGIVI